MILADALSCTLSDVCIDYLGKHNFDFFISCDGDGRECIEWIAEREDLGLYASDPVRLAALYLIHDDWISNREVPEYIKKMV